MTNEKMTASHGFPDRVLPILTTCKIGPKISSSAIAFRTLELPMSADNSPEKVVAMIPMGTSGDQKTIDCSTWVSPVNKWRSQLDARSIFSVK